MCSSDLVSDSPAANLYVMKEMVTASVDVKQAMMIMKAYMKTLAQKLCSKWCDQEGCVEEFTS